MVGRQTKVLVGVEVIHVVQPKEQEEAYSCGLEMVKLILEAVGRDDLVDEELETKVGTTPAWGTSPVQIKAFFDREGIVYTEEEGCHIMDIRNYLEMGCICLVVYQLVGEKGPTDDDGHYSVIFGIRNKKLLMADPVAFDGEGVRDVDADEFFGLWWDKDYDGNLYDHWMLAVPVAVKGVVLH